MAKCINIRDKALGGKDFSKDEVYIGRTSIWGNPYVIGKDGSREEVIAKYRDYVFGNRFLLDQLHTLRGKDLVCFCKPKACHGDVLVELVKYFYDRKYAAYRKGE